MIRRLFWLGAGTALGILGYRRLERLVRSAPRRVIAAGTSRLTLTRGAPQELAAPAVRELPAGAGGFLSDVRDGMDEYLNRHASQLGNTLLDQRPARGG